jgi:hypothetical protein
MTQVLGVEVQPTVAKEPVMNVPAIDMTDAVAASRNAPRAGGRPKAKRATSGRKQPARPAQAKAKAKTNRRDGSVGRDTFERVEALVKTGKTKSEAFKQVAKDIGRNEGTVSANYYRVARASGAVTPRPRRGRESAATSTRGRQNGAQSVTERRSVSGGNSLDQVVGQLVASVHALTEAVKAQDAEVRELRGRLDEARGLLG